MFSDVHKSNVVPENIFFIQQCTPSSSITLFMKQIASDSGLELNSLDSSMLLDISSWCNLSSLHKEEQTRVINQVHQKFFSSSIMDDIDFFS